MATQSTKPSSEFSRLQHFTTCPEIEVPEGQKAQCVLCCGNLYESPSPQSTTWMGHLCETKQVGKALYHVFHKKCLLESLLRNFSPLTIEDIKPHHYAQRNTCPMCRIPFAKDDLPFTKLAVASLVEDMSIFKDLEENEVPISLLDQSVLLRTACQKGYLQAVQFFIYQAGFKSPQVLASALETALENDQMLYCLLFAGAELPLEQLQETLKTAIRRNALNIVDLLIERKDAISPEDYHEVLIQALRSINDPSTQSQGELAALLLSKGVNGKIPAETQLAAIRLIVEAPHPERADYPTLMRRLIQHADQIPEKARQQIFAHTVSKNQHTLVAILLSQQGFTSEADRIQALDQALQLKHIESIHALLKQEGSIPKKHLVAQIRRLINIETSQPHNPEDQLIVAAVLQHTDKLLKEMVDSPTQFMEATSQRNHEKVKTLIEEGLVDLSETLQTQGLLSAVQNNDIEMITIFRESESFNSMPAFRAAFAKASGLYLTEIADLLRKKTGLPAKKLSAIAQRAPLQELQEAFENHRLDSVQKLIANPNLTIPEETRQQMLASAITKNRHLMVKVFIDQDGFTSEADRIAAFNTAVELRYLETLSLLIEKQGAIPRRYLLACMYRIFNPKTFQPYKSENMPIYKLLMEHDNTLILNLYGIISEFYEDIDFGNFQAVKDKLEAGLIDLSEEVQSAALKHAVSNRDMVRLFLATPGFNSERAFLAAFLIANTQGSAEITALLRPKITLAEDHLQALIKQEKDKQAQTRARQEYLSRLYSEQKP